MNVEIALQEGIYNEISILLSKSNTVEKASSFVAHFFQKKVHEGVIDMYDYTIVDASPNGFHATIEYSFAWNISNTCSALVYPKHSPAAAFDRAMGVVG